MKKKVHQCKLLGLTVFCIILWSNSNVFALYINLELKHRIDSLLTVPKDVVFIELVSKKPRQYLAGVFSTINYPFTRVSKELLNFDQYEDMFRDVHRFKRLPVQDSINSIGTFYAEGRARLLRVWGIGVIDSLKILDSTKIVLFASQNENKALNNHWREKKRGWFTIEITNMNMMATLVRVDEMNCRLGIVAWANPKVRIPKWIFKFAIRILFPRFIKDIETVVVDG